MAEVKKQEAKIYLLNNKSKRILTINGVRLFVGVNKITEEALKKLKASPYFVPYFDDEKDFADRLEFIAGFGPEDSKYNSLTELSEKEFKKVVSEIFDLELLKQLDIDVKKSEFKDIVKKQMQKVLPSKKEINE